MMPRPGSVLALLFIAGLGGCSDLQRGGKTQAPAPLSAETSPLSASPRPGDFSKTNFHKGIVSEELAKSTKTANSFGPVPAEIPPSMENLPAEHPAGLQVAVPTEFDVAGDRPIRVTHAQAEIRQAIVYLHGMCGDPKGADKWADLAAQRGTLIVLRADVPCPDRPGYKWPKDPQLIQKRIDAALLVVAQQRGGLLDKEELTLIGYSQGAHRAEQLAFAAPERYPWVVLGGPPTAPTPELLRRSQRVAVLGGEFEDTTHMESGTTELQKVGIASQFFRLPGSHHGDYGTEGRRVILEVFSFLDAGN